MGKEPVNSPAFQKARKGVDPPGGRRPEKLDCSPAEGGIGVKERRDNGNSQCSGDQHQGKDQETQWASRQIPGPWLFSEPPGSLLKCPERTEERTVHPSRKKCTHGKYGSSPPPSEGGRDSLNAGQKRRRRPACPKQEESQEEEKDRE